MNDATKPVVAVAGGTGFVGGAIAAELAARGCRVIALSHRRPTAAASAASAASPATGSSPAIEYRKADVTRPQTLLDAVEGARVLVIALAFRGFPVETPRHGQTFERVDAAGTEALVAAAKSAGIERLVYLSGAGAAPNADKPWYRAKWRAEQAVKYSGIPYTIFRPSWIYGPRDRSLNRFLGMSRWLPFVPQIGSGRQRLMPVFIDDMAALVADALDPANADATRNVTFEVGGPQELSMDDVVKTALALSGRRRVILHTPVALMKLASLPLQVLPWPPLSPGAVDFVVQSAVVDTALLRERLPRRLRTIEEGMATYMRPRR